MSLTIQNIIDQIIAEVTGKHQPPLEPFTDTVDVIKVGDASQPVTGIATTFLASQEVIQKAMQAGANLIIAHEPVFYNHLDRVDWLQENGVYQAKRRLLEESGMVVWRFHDYWHTHQPDGIYVGLIQRLGWENYFDPAQEAPIFTIPSMTVGELAAFLKTSLGAAAVRVVGDLDMPCSRVGFLVGAGGAEWAINFAAQEPAVDALVCGEGGGEWETCEFMRDAITQGKKQALLLVGHAASEEPGMAYLVDWLRQRFPGIAVQHIPVGEPFKIV